jgi:hypothetical protein
MNELVLIPSADDITLAEHAAVIRVLGKRVVGDIIEIGRRLHACKEQVGHGGWLPWLDREFGWSADTAERFMQVHALADKIRTVRNLEIPVTGLYLLATPSTPAEVQQAVIERAEAGDAPTAAEIKQMIADAKAQTESDADARLQRERTHYEGKLGEVRREADRREAAVREEYDGKLILDPADIEQALAERTAPLKARIERYEKRLAELTEREERRKAAKPAMPAQPPIDSTAHTASTMIAGSLERLTPHLAVTPATVIAVEQRLLSATGQTLQQRIGRMVRDAETVRAWLDEFCREAQLLLEA